MKQLIIDIADAIKINGTASIKTYYGEYFSNITEIIINNNLLYITYNNNDKSAIVNINDIKMIKYNSSRINHK